MPNVPKVLPPLVPLVLNHHAQGDPHLDPLGQTKVIKCQDLLVPFLWVTVFDATQDGAVHIPEPAPLFRLVTLEQLIKTTICWDMRHRSWVQMDPEGIHLEAPRPWRASLV